MGDCYLKCGAYSAPKELCTPKFSQFWGTLMQQPMWPHIYDTRTNMAMMRCYIAHMWHLEMHWECITTCEIWCEHIIMANGHHHIGLKICMQWILIYDPMLTIIQFMKEERNGTNKTNCLKVKKKQDSQTTTYHSCESWFIIMLIMSCIFQLIVFTSVNICFINENCKEKCIKAIWIKETSKILPKHYCPLMRS